MPINQSTPIGQGELGIGRPQHLGSQSASFAASIATGYRGDSIFGSAVAYDMSISPLYFGPAKPSTGNLNFQQRTLSRQQSHIQSIYNYRTPFWQGISNHGSISGLHPGNGGYNTAVIRAMTGFGSGANLSKIIQHGEKHREYTRQLLHQLNDKDTNLIFLDIETAGTGPVGKTAIEMVSPETGVIPTTLTEVYLQSNKAGRQHFFTKGATNELYQKAIAGGGNASAMFKAQQERLVNASQLGIETGYGYEQALDQIVGHLDPNKKNILLGHNLVPFDLKVLSAHAFMENQGSELAPLIAKLKAGDNKDWSTTNTINEMWQKYMVSKDKLWREHAANLDIIDTLGQLVNRGSFQKWPSTGNGGLTGGLTSSFIHGYFPSAAGFWNTEVGGTAGKYALAKGSNQEAIARYLGIDKDPEVAGFMKDLHNPASDIGLLKKILPAMHEKSKLMDAAIEQGNGDVLRLEELKFMMGQRRSAAESLGKHLLNVQQAKRAGNEGLVKQLQEKAGVETWQGIIDATGKLSGEYKSLLRKSPQIKEKITGSIWEGLRKAPLGMKLAIGAGSGLVAWSLWDHLTGTKKIDGMHPGNAGYSTSTIQGMTDFGSGWQAGKGLQRAYSIFTNPVVSGIGATLILGEPSFSSMPRMAMLGTMAGALGYARGGWTGVGVGLGAFAIIDRLGHRVLQEADEGDKRSGFHTLKRFAVYGAVEGALSTAASAAFIKGSPIRHFADQFMDIMGADKEVVGISKEFAEVASPFRRMYQPSINEMAEKFGRWTGAIGSRVSEANMKKIRESFIPFSEAFHGESAYMTRAAMAAGGDIRKVKAAPFIEALGKDLAIGSMGGLLEGVAVGGIYVLLKKMMSGGNKIDGLHPGNQGYSTYYVQNMTGFGSGADLWKIIGESIEWMQKAGINKDTAALRMKPAAQAKTGIKVIFSGESHGRVSKQIHDAKLAIKDFDFGFVTEESIPMGSSTKKIFLPRAATEELYGFENSDQWRVQREAFSSINKPSSDIYMSRYLEMQTFLNEGIHPGAGPRSLGKPSIQSHSEFGTGWDPKWVASKLMKSKKIDRFVEGSFSRVIHIAKLPEQGLISHKLKQMETTGLMHILDDNAIKHTQMGSRTPI